MTLENYQKLAGHIFRLLKVTEITFPLGRTNKGNLGIVFRQDTQGFDIMLDSVPLETKSLYEDENNIELKNMIEKYWFEQTRSTFATLMPNMVKTDSVLKSEDAVKITPIEPVKSRGGRPKGSKNGTKTHA